MVSATEWRSGDGMAGKRVAVLMGGRTGEREASLRSGRACAATLEQQGYRVTRIDVGRDIASLLATLKPEVALNLLHGRPGVDGAIQGLLEVLAIPYTHSGVLASALVARPDVANAMLRAAGVPVAEDLATLPADAAKSLACAVVGDKALSVADVATAGTRNAGAGTHVVPAQLPPAVEHEARTLALAAHRALGCRGISRVDLRHGAGSAETGRLACLGVDAHPDMSETALVPSVAAHAGIAFGDLVRWMVEDASLNR
jgi:D-alanine-D-alanine ligase